MRKETKSGENECATNKTKSFSLTSNHFINIFGRFAYTIVSAFANNHFPVELDRFDYLKQQPTTKQPIYNIDNSELVFRFGHHISILLYYVYVSVTASVFVPYMFERWARPKMQT